MTAFRWLLGLGAGLGGLGIALALREPSSGPPGASPSTSAPPPTPPSPAGPRSPGISVDPPPQFFGPPLPPPLSAAAVAAQIHEAYKARANMTRSLADDLVAVATAVDADPFALANLIHFESGFRPDVRNTRTGATGLIQFMPGTAVGLGTTTDKLAAMTARQQMPFVKTYLQRARAGRSLQHPASLYMAVFYPAFIGQWDRLFPANVRAANPGIESPNHYVSYVNRNAKLPETTGAGVA